MEHKGTQSIDTERLLLRRFAAADAPYMYANWAGDARVTEFLRWPPHENLAATEAVVEEWVAAYADERFYQWAIVLRETNEPIGSISVVGMDEKTEKLHIGYCIGVPWWHKGYTSEALAALLPFLFYEVGAKRVEAQHDPANPHSGAVMRKCGLTPEGVLRKADWCNRGIVDVVLYALLAEDYPPPHM